MPTAPGHERSGDTIPHQAAVEGVVEEHVDDVIGDSVDTTLAATSDHAAIADLAAPSATYVEAEALAARGKINEILDVLRDSGLIPSS